MMMNPWPARIVMVVSILILSACFVTLVAG